MTSGVTIEGLNKTVRTLEKAGVEIQDLKAAFKKVSDLVTGEAKARVPVKTGKLQASIRSGNSKNKAVVRAGSARVPYAGPINYGWSRKGIRRTDFLTGPANANPGRYANIIDDELRSLIRRLGLN
jgi:hypothetical protein